MDGFRQAVHDCRLVDLPMEGYPFTWVRSKDHSSILLHTKKRIGGQWQRRFRFENKCCEEPDLGPLVQ
ncbi:hypothetical protein LINGRAHAP2_LOCUS23787, partial [Linum grandiflorum]